jgi:hypothetical protein
MGIPVDVYPYVIESRELLAHLSLAVALRWLLHRIPEADRGWRAI